MERRARTFFPLGFAEASSSSQCAQLGAGGWGDSGASGWRTAWGKGRGGGGPRTILKGQRRKLGLLEHSKLGARLCLVAAIGGEAVGGAVGGPRGGGVGAGLVARAPAPSQRAAALFLAVADERRHCGAEKSTVGDAVEKSVHRVGVDWVKLSEAAQSLRVEAVEEECVKEIQSRSGGLGADGLFAPRTGGDPRRRDL